jgi:glycosyltransferase involved in cell wall biosynthesis
MGGYIFSGGRSRRDFATFFDAVAPLGYPVKVIAAPEAELAANGCSLAGVKVPQNVEIITDNPDPKFFNELMANARLVVLPILSGTTTQAGIGVYLQAMALGKCVVVSTGLGVDDVLDSGQAVIVEAGNTEQLRSAIQRMWTDDGAREAIASKGKQYAIGLGGEDDLRRSVLGAVGLAA